MGGFGIDWYITTVYIVSIPQIVKALCTIYYGADSKLVNQSVK